MSKPIVLTFPKWDLLYERLRKDNPPSVMLIRSKTRDVLGFQAREHTEWIYMTNGISRPVQRTTVHLDFYDDLKKTMFMLKYSDYL
jgi:hypothetical protein